MLCFRDSIRAWYWLPGISQCFLRRDLIDFRTGGIAFRADGGLPEGKLIR
jgi:hypothetical protein